MLVLFVEIVITVERTPTSGSFGTIQVGYATLSPTETYPYVPSDIDRAGLSEFIASTGFLIFSPGQTLEQFNVTIKSSALPELDRAVFVRLNSIVLIHGQQTRPGEPRTITAVRKCADWDTIWLCFRQTT